MAQIGLKQLNHDNFSIARNTRTQTNTLQLNIAGNIFVAFVIGDESSNQFLRIVASILQPLAQQRIHTCVMDLRSNPINPQHQQVHMIAGQTTTKIQNSPCWNVFVNGTPAVQMQNGLANPQAMIVAITRAIASSDPTRLQQPAGRQGVVNMQPAPVGTGPRAQTRTITNNSQASANPQLNRQLPPNSAQYTHAPSNTSMLMQPSGANMIQGSSQLTPPFEDGGSGISQSPNHVFSPKQYGITQQGMTRELLEGSDANPLNKPWSPDIRSGV